MIYVQEINYTSTCFRHKSITNSPRHSATYKSRYMVYRIQEYMHTDTNTRLYYNSTNTNIQTQKYNINPKNYNKNTRRSGVLRNARTLA